mmetsp:Transcript_13165/g.23201  ORF Transcript_13165/g.23201 Transcript_13165/m.23201 type:complete len:351 (+) Transcript_13165:85-1137(+)
MTGGRGEVQRCGLQWAACVLLLLSVTVQGARTKLTPLTELIATGKEPTNKKIKHPFKSPTGFFIQERASKQLPGPGQHFQFGALQQWEAILETVQSIPDAKLLLLVRHGQALSNWLQDTLGPDIWFGVEDKCTYDDKNGTVYGVFDAELTDLGQDQGRYLNTILAGGGWFSRMTGNLSSRAIVSPLSRCLATSMLVSEGLPITSWSVEEGVRETLGEDTCDARRSVSDPDPAATGSVGPCTFKQGLRTKFPQFEFPVVDKQGGLGLVSDQDTLWTKNRETQKDQVKRATRFLTDLWANVQEKVVVVFTHSGFTRSVLLAAGREPYKPQNTELVPAIVFKVSAGPGETDVA